jgi:hypothetical protein
MDVIVAKKIPHRYGKSTAVFASGVVDDVVVVADDVARKLI